MVAISSHGKHRVRREGRVKRFVRRYHSSHKPVHLCVTGGIFCVEIVAVIFHVEMIFHIMISASATTWEAMVITLSE